MKVRVYQIAKEMKRTATEIIAVLEKLGVQGKHHTSSIDDDLVPKIRRYLEPYAKRAETPRKEEEVIEEPEIQEEVAPPPVVEQPKVQEATVAKGKKKTVPAPAKEPPPPVVHATSHAAHPTPHPLKELRTIKHHEAPKAPPAAPVVARVVEQPLPELHRD